VPKHLSVIDTSFPLYNYVIVNSTSLEQSFDTDVKLYNKNFLIQTTALFDTGAWSCFIGKQCFINSGFKQIPLPNNRVIRAFNADGLENKGSAIMHYCQVQLHINGHESTQAFLITNLGPKDLIIGYSFIQHHNPVFNFGASTMEFSRCPLDCKHGAPIMKIDEEDLDGLNLPHLEDVAAVFTPETDKSWENNATFIHWIKHLEEPIAQYLLAHTVNKEEFNKSASARKDDKDYWSPYVPQQYHQYGEVFSKLASQRMPTRNRMTTQLNSIRVHCYQSLQSCTQ
jgi:hypothetical protein